MAWDMCPVVPFYRDCMRIDDSFNKIYQLYADHLFAKDNFQINSLILRWLAYTDRRKSLKKVFWYIRLFNILEYYRITR